jgi:thioredoxin reductase (NADPH)
MMQAPGRTADSRAAQMFPLLEQAEIARIARFGEPRRYADGEMLFRSGEPGPGMFILLSGQVRITRRDGLGHVALVVEHEPGSFMAETGQLSGRVALVDGHAVGEVDTLLVPPERLRALLVAEASLGERIMRALILRRVSLIESGAGGPVLIGPANAAGTARLAGFLTRNGYPHQVVDPELDIDARALLAQYAPSPADLPLVVCADGSVLRNPDEPTLSRHLGMVTRPEPGKVYDVAIVGAGPAGLATAVYAASEGLSVTVLDQRAFGGQAGASARIENYFGFPTGISGQALAGRAFVQAQKFGVEFAIPAHVEALECGAPSGECVHALVLDDGERLRARTVVIASGARYRRPHIPELARFEGRGVWYWASPVEARMCARTEVVLVGGGNSAGQAAVFLSAHAARVRMMVRGPSLAASMSRYLIDRIEAADNIALMFDSEIAALHGSASALERVTWRNRRTGEEGDIATGHVFLFVGADPETDWLADCGVRLDRGGFVHTGAAADTRGQATTLPLETDRPGVFAVGDVRAGSVKRVGGAIGEGAAVVAQIHQYLAAQPQREAVAT